MEDDIKRWTARRKSALVLEIIQGRADRGLGASDRMVPPPDARPEERTLHRRAQPPPRVRLVVAPFRLRSRRMGAQQRCPRAAISGLSGPVIGSDGESA